MIQKNELIKQKPVTMKIGGTRESGVAYLFDRSQEHETLGLNDRRFYLRVVCDDGIHFFDAEYTDLCKADEDYTNLIFIED